MENEYIVINKTELLKRMKELEREYNQEPEEHMKDWFLGQIEALKQTLFQSTPLIPEIEKSIDYGIRKSFSSKKHSEVKQEYISNLKLDI